MHRPCGTLRATNDYLFDPNDAGGRSRGVKRPHYTKDTLCRSVHRACEKARVEHWTPHQLRHLVAHEVRDRAGLEAAQAILGHATLNMSEHYSANRSRVARSAVEVIGTDQGRRA